MAEPADAADSKGDPGRGKRGNAANSGPPIREEQGVDGAIGQSLGNQLLVDPVEAALAIALDRASEAGQWAAVEVLARELEGRRRARSSVVRLDAARGRGDRNA